MPLEVNSSSQYKPSIHELNLPGPVSLLDCVLLAINVNPCGRQSLPRTCHFSHNAHISTSFIGIGLIGTLLISLISLGKKR